MPPCTGVAQLWDPRTGALLSEEPLDADGRWEFVAPDERAYEVVIVFTPPAPRRD